MFDERLGCFETLWVQRVTSDGALLTTSEHASDDTPTLLLPIAEVPQDAREGEALEVFVAQDSTDRPIATRREPKVALDEVAFLEVLEVTHFGAFFDWGLPRDLLVPRRELTRDVAIGERHPISVFVAEGGRLTGTMRVTELLAEGGDFRVGEWVPGEAWRFEPDLGLFVIVERTSVGLLPATEPQPLHRGEAARFRVTRVLPDGKIELSLRPPAHEARDGDAERILALMRRPDAPRLGDHCSPDDLRDWLGLSKKAFKRAVGGLLRGGDVDMDAEGFLSLPKAPRS